MARNILIVEPSLTMRKILQTMILADISDAVLYEAWTVPDAIVKANTQPCNLVLFHLDSSNTEWRQFFDKMRSADGRMKAPIVLLTSQPTAKPVIEALKAGAVEVLAIPCGAEALVDTVNRVCNPVTLRFTKRYSIPEIMVYLEQRGQFFEGKLVNISKGGLLFEWEWLEGFQWQLPCVLTIKYFMAKETMQVKDMFSTLVSLIVGASHADFSPKMVRTAFKFINLSEENSKALDEIFAKAEIEQKLLLV